MVVTHRFPNAPASLCFRTLAQRIAQQDNTRFSDSFIWEKLLNDWVN